MKRVQRPTNESNWLYKDTPDWGRLFVKEITLAPNDTEWAECIDADKVAWEEAHKVEEPEEPQEAEQ